MRRTMLLKNDMFNIPTVEEIISVLKRYGLEDKHIANKDCILAGGAVANVIYGMLNGIDKNDFVVNDIDIFTYTNDDIEEDETARTVVNTATGQQMGNGYRQNWARTSESHRIVATDRDGIANYVYIDTKDPFEFKDVISEFDLNCCKAGIIFSNTMAEPELVIDNAYLAFLASKVIRSGQSGLFTPYHTLVRLYKKSAEFNLPMADFDLSLVDEEFEAPMLTDKYKQLFDKYVLPTGKYELVEEKGNSETSLYSIR